MKKLLRISILAGILLGVFVYVVQPNDSALYFGFDGPQYGNLASRSVDDPNRSDAPYLGMKTHSESGISISNRGPQIILQSKGSYVNKNSVNKRSRFQASVTGGSQAISVNNISPSHAAVSPINGGGYMQFPNVNVHDSRKRFAKENDDIVEIGQVKGVDINGPGPEIGGQKPNDTPIGDAIFPLSFMLFLFMAFKFARSRA